MDRKVTLDDVARLSNVSRSAASRAINNRPGVRPDVREHDQSDRRASRLPAQPGSQEPRVRPVVGDRVGDPDRRSARRSLRGGDDPCRRSGDGGARSRPDAAPRHRRAGGDLHHVLSDGLIDGLLVSSVAVGTWVDDLFDSALPHGLDRYPSHTRRRRSASTSRTSSRRRWRSAHLFDQGARGWGASPVHSTGPTPAIG